MTNPFLIKELLKDHSLVLAPDKCRHQRSCEENIGVCTHKNLDSIHIKPVSYIDNCCCSKLSCINSYGFNSDEFTKIHNGKHILFAGCSYTHGSGVTRNELWANIVYKNILMNEKCSGFFNIGFPATSIPEQLFMIMKYIENFGNPDVIFWMVPPVDRGFSSFESNNFMELSGFTDETYTILPETNKDGPKYLSHTNEMSSYMAYSSVHIYCKKSNIDLYSFPWDPDAQKYKNSDRSPFFGFSQIKEYNTFYSWEKKSLVEFCKKFDKSYNGENKEFLQISRDNNHLGIAPHAFWADFIYRKYLNDNIRN